MPINQALIAELQYESESIRKMLDCIPEQSLNWKPHEKSMPLGRLTMHIAELSGWFVNILEADELDFAKTDYKPIIAKSKEELLKSLEENLKKGTSSLQKASDEIFYSNWKLRSGDTIYFELPKIQVIRSMVLNHIIHHRGQLSVYLRLLNIPLPQVYGPTADERNNNI